MHKLLIACAFSLFLLSCESGKPERGFQYMPDMYQSPALKSQESYTLIQIDDSGKEITIEVPAMRVPPQGTVPRHFIPYEAAADVDLGKKLINPLAATEDVLRLGRDKYDQFCAVCHGKDGDAAKGYVASKFGGILPINTDVVAAYEDGHIFWIITAGRNRMPDYSAQLNAEERWAVIHYVRALGQATKGKADKQLQKGGESFEPLPEPVPEYKRSQWLEVTK